MDVFPIAFKPAAQHPGLMFQRLLVAIDSSAHAQLALAAAIELAQATNGKLTVITVAPEPTSFALGGGRRSSIVPASTT